jgi:hypothetical protein
MLGTTLAACVGGSNNPDGGACGAVGAHTALPQLQRQGGTVQSKVKLVTVTFAGYTHRQQVEAFGDFLVGSRWLETVGADYGVGQGMHLRKVALADSAPATIKDEDIAPMILQPHVQDNSLPPPDEQTFYMVYFPMSTTVDSGLLKLGQPCVDFEGFHDDITLAGAHFIYGVVLDCGTENYLPIASHELIGGATNPSTGGWNLAAAATDPWSALNGYEPADLCEGEGTTTEAGYQLARAWSITAAQAGTQPCVPAAPGETYYQVTADPATVQTVPAGGMVNLTLTGWSTGTLPNWFLGVEKMDGSAFDPQPTLSANTINVGCQVTLTLHAGDGKSGQVGTVLVWSGPTMEERRRAWPVAVTVQ